MDFYLLQGSIKIVLHSIKCNIPARTRQIFGAGRNIYVDDCGRGPPSEASNVIGPLVTASWRGNARGLVARLPLDGTPSRTPTCPKRRHAIGASPTYATVLTIMYIRPVHAEHDLPTLHTFIRENPLGVLTTAIESPTHHFLQSSHIPWILDVSADPSSARLGTLRGHIARANPQAKAMIADLTDGASQATAPKLAKDVLVLFTAPVQQHYITPKFYTTTKPATGKVVPTWNYAAVQVYGRATVFCDATDADGATDAFLSQQIRDLSHFAETNVMGRERPWAVDDAPESYVELLKKAIVGIEVEITDIAGRWKMSQELGAGDREGALQGFEGMGTEVGDAMARMVRERAELAARKAAQ